MFCVNGADEQFGLLTHGARGDFSIFHLNEDINTWTTSPELIWESLHEHFTILLE